MVNINVSYDDMQRESAALVSGMNEINSQLTALRSRIQNLVTSGFVTDSASGAFNQSYETFNQGATQTISGLEGLANTLTSIASTLQDADSQIARSIGG